MYRALNSQLYQITTTFTKELNNSKAIKPTNSKPNYPTILKKTPI